MKLIFFFIGAIVGYAIMTQVPGIDPMIVGMVTFAFGAIPAAVV